MKYVPIWLHCWLLRFAWYRAKCGIQPMSPLMVKICMEALHLAMPFALDVGRNYSDDYKAKPGATIKVRRPTQYTRRVVSGD